MGLDQLPEEAGGDEVDSNSGDGAVPCSPIKHGRLARLDYRCAPWTA